ncbi:type II toxin-antitoxin system VapC family toxin [Bythopirellula polymerisocia]|uniref:PIN domain protein n=1 Tax=Bythopirellula polymerisocia TaxID=2528003 RepID=A0A5C6CWL4_9BACT|nr:type II toxin-antitoxin system VapC family toxin [Bythopirellula polymerisocia]TWU28114.1 PIN domain protein [Bythopirellula polymerisocia]
MKSQVYIETTIISYLTAWRSPQLVMAAHQQATREWWDNERQNFELFVSEAVLEEASAGDNEAAQKRMDIAREILELQITDEIRDLAKALLKHGMLPEKAAIDALHIATATLNGMEYLLTWNCRHIANATLQKSMREVCESADLILPILCTPLELRGSYDDE